MKKALLKTALLCALVCFGLSSQASAGPPSHSSGKPSKIKPPPPRPPKWPPSHHNAPFDGGASLLVGAGVVYGVKKAFNRRKKANQ
jgi:hypothetical protein